MSRVLQKIKQRGYWEIVIRPSEYRKVRAPIQNLLPVMQHASVEWTGWDFPHIDRQQAPQIDLNWIQSEVDWQHYVEVWRLYQSGQFLYYGGLTDDWLDQSTLVDQRYPQNTCLSVILTVFRYTKVFELASRLSATEVGAGAMTVGISIVGLQGRTLRMDNPNRVPFLHPYSATLVRFPKVETLSSERLVAEGREVAVKWVEELLARFGWTPGAEFLRTVQAELFHRC